MSDDGMPVSEGQLDAVERSVSRTDAGDTIRTVVTISQSYPTDLDDLWTACTTPERLPRWFALVHGDLRLGGRYQIEGNAAGSIESCDPPQGFSATWEFGGEISRIEVRLKREGDGGSRLTLLHRADLDATWWNRYGPGAGGVGWDLALFGLAHHLATRSMSPLEATAWSQTEDARAFMAESSRRWADASIRSGTPEAEARAAEARTTAFYLGTAEAEDEGT